MSDVRNHKKQEQTDTGNNQKQQQQQPKPKPTNARAVLCVASVIIVFFGAWFGVMSMWVQHENAQDQQHLLEDVRRLAEEVSALAEHKIKPTLRKPQRPDEVSAVVEHKIKPMRQQRRTIGGNGVEEEEIEEDIHWMFTTDCTAYQYTQANMLLASAVEKEIIGTWTWIIYGCEPLLDHVENDDDVKRHTRALLQREFLKNITHPNCTVYFMPAGPLKHPDTGEELQHFQASNRPLSMLKWWGDVKHNFTAKAIMLLDPDMMFTRPIVFVKGRDSSIPRVQDQKAGGPWKVPMVGKGRGAGARWYLGCPISKYKNNITQICGDRADLCDAVATGDKSRCGLAYDSGPPWVFPVEGFDDFLRDLLPTAIRMHFITDNHILSEQYSFGISQMMNGITNDLDTFWYMSSPGDIRPDVVNNDGDEKWDPCATRSILPPNEYGDRQPLLHTCYTYDIPKIKGFRLHKDHAHKDILDCDQPLLHYPPRDTLSNVLKDASDSDRRAAWMVCIYTNHFNHNVERYKRQFCPSDRMNLEPSFKYPQHGHLYRNKTGRLSHAFRPGGWADRGHDYKWPK